MKWPHFRTKEVVTLCPTPGSETNFLLELFSEDNKMTIADVTRKTHEHRLMVSGRLATLADLGYLSREKVGTAWYYTLQIDLYGYNNNTGNSTNTDNNI